MQSRRKIALNNLCLALGDTLVSVHPRVAGKQSTITYIRNGVEATVGFKSYLTKSGALKEVYLKEMQEGIKKPVPEDQKYAKRSATTRRNYLDSIAKLCASRGDLFICVEFLDTNNYIYFEREGEVCRQHVYSYKAKLGLQKDYLAKVRNPWPEGSGLYKFYIHDELVYIGKTSSYKNRFSKHFNGEVGGLQGRHGRLRDLITKIEVYSCGEADRNVMEMYLIAKYKPSFNVADVPSDSLTLELPEPNFTELTGWA